MKKIIIITLVIILLVILGAIYMIKNGNLPVTPSNNGYNESNYNDEILVPAKVFDHLSNAKISCKQESDNLIPTKEVVFEINFDDVVSDEYVQNTFSLRDLSNNKILKTNVIKKENKTYELKAEEELKEGTIYNVEERTTSGTNKWAFQTEKELKVLYSYPQNEKSISTKGIPEIQFNSNIDKNIDINDYFSIEPKINGSWSIENYRVLFRHPSENFSANETYTIKVKPGICDEYGNILNEEKIICFDAYDELNSKLSGVYVESENAFKKNEKVSFDVFLDIFLSSKDDRYTVSDGSIKIIEIADRDDYISNMKKLNTVVGTAKELWNSKNYSVKYENNIIKDKEFVDKEAYEWGKYSRNKVFKEYVKTDFSSGKAGFYIALVNIGKMYIAKPFQINDNMASFNQLSTGELFIAYKDKDNKNNRVDVYVNSTKIGSTDGDGILYIEKQPEYEDGFNFIEFNCGENIILDISSAANSYSENTKEIKARFSNGYIYHDRKSYKIGETINIFGYARNRVYGVKEAKLVFQGNGHTIEEKILTLDELGGFVYSFDTNKLTNNMEIEVALYIDGVSEFTRWIRILDYDIKQYNVDVAKDGYVFIAGESSNINMSATTYDDTPLSDISFKVSVPDHSGAIDVKAQDLVTDDLGNAQGTVEFILKNQPTTTYSEYFSVRLENSYLDGGEEYLQYVVFPYKNTANADVSYDPKTNTYDLKINEYNVKDRESPANDSIIVRAIAKDVRREVYRKYVDQTTKEEKAEYRINCYNQSNFDKEFTLDVKDGKASLNVPNWSDTKNEKGFYDFYIYIKSDLGYELLAQRDYDDYWMIYKGNWWEDEEQIKTEPVTTANEEKIDSNNEKEKEEESKGNTIPSYTLELKNSKVEFGSTVEYELKNSNYNTGYYDYYIDDYYEPLENNDSEESIDYSNIEIYALLTSGRGVEILRAKSDTLKFNASLEMGFNASIYPLIYDGEKIYSPNYQRYIYSSYDLGSERNYRSSLSMNIGNDERKIDLSIKFDKEVYKPGEEATIDIETTYKGNGERSLVNISAIDMAYLDENGEVGADIDYSVTNYYYVGAQEISSSFYPTANMYSDERGGGDGGGGDGDRNKIQMTGFFEKVITDDNGKAQIKVTFPDNITRWYITSQCISKNYRTDTTTNEIVTSMPYYVGLTLKDYYIQDEKFAFNIKSIGNGLSGKDTTLKVSLLDNAKNEIETETIGTKVGKVVTYKVKNGLKTGKYFVRLEGTCEDYKDSLITAISVKETLLETLSREEITDILNVNAKQANLYVFNKELKDIIDTLFELSALKYNSNRYDYQFVATEAEKILNNLKQGTPYVAGQDRTNLDYESHKKINYIMENADFDADLALRNFATKGLYTYDTEAVLNLKSRLEEEAKLWMLATENNANLKQLREVKDKIVNQPSDYTVEKVLYIALALAEVGDYDNGMELYNMISNSIKEDTREYDLFVILTIKLNHENRKEIYTKYISKDNLPEVENYIKLYYVQNEVAKNFEKGELKIKVDGQNEEIKLSNFGFTRYPVSSNHNYEIVSKSDNIVLSLEDYKTLNLDDYEEKEYIKKSYSNENPDVGTNTKITITVDAQKLFSEFGTGTYTLQDIMPNNLNFIQTINSESSNNFWFDNKSGQMLEYSLWISKNSPKQISIVYEARISNDGDMVESGVILKDSENRIIDIIKYE